MDEQKTNQQIKKCTHQQRTQRHSNPGHDDNVILPLGNHLAYFALQQQPEDNIIILFLGPGIVAL